MPEPTTAEKFQRNPPKDRYQELRDKFRRNPPTPLGSSAMLGGPGREPALAAAESAEAGKPEPGSPAGPLIETALSIGMGAFPGGPAAARLASGMVSRLGRLGAEIVGRGTMAATGGVLGSELAAPEGETSGEAQTRRNIAGGTSFAGEVLTPGLKAAISPVLTPLRHRLGGLGARELLELGAEESQALLQSMGRTLTPGQMRTGKLLDTFENIIAASFGGGQIMGIHQRRAELDAIGHIEQVVPQLTKNLSNEDAGLALNAALRGEVRLDRAATSAAYREATAKILQAGGTGEIVPVQPFMDAATKRLGVDPKDAGSLEILSSLRRFGDVERISLEQAERLRSELLAIGRRGEGILPTPKVFAKELAKSVDDTMTVSTLSLGRFGPEVVAAVDRARAFSRISHERWGHDLVANLLERVKPEDIPKLVLADDNPTQVRMVREALFDPKYRIGRLGPGGEIVPPVKNPMQTWKGIQSAWMAEKSVVGEYGTLSGKKLGAAIDQAGGTAKELLSAPEKKNLRIAARALELIQNQAGAGREGAIWMQLAQAGAASVLLGFGPSDPGKQVGAGVIVFGPIIPALLLTNPRFANFMMQQAKSSAQRTGRLASSTAAQAISHLVAEKIPFTWKGFDGQTIEHVPEGDPLSPPSPSPPTKDMLKPQSKF